MTKSNMYEFIGKTINPLLGECLNSCQYCYVNGLKQRFENLNNRYSGEIRLDEKVLKKPLKMDILYFVGSCNDIFAENVPDEYIVRILRWIGNAKVLLQTKNPAKMLRYIPLIKYGNPNATMCITVETSDMDLLRKCTNAPTIRIPYIKEIAKEMPTQVTIEPIMNLGSFDDIKAFAEELSNLGLQQVNIGANSSKTISLPEPSRDELLHFIIMLKIYKVKVHLKDNIKRILKDENKT